MITVKSQSRRSRGSKDQKKERKVAKAERKAAKSISKKTKGKLPDAGAQTVRLDTAAEMHKAATLVIETQRTSLSMLLSDVVNSSTETDTQAPAGDSELHTIPSEPSTHGQ